MLRHKCYGARDGAVVRALASHQCGPVQILASRPHVGWVCCWFSPLLREIFLRVLRFPLSSSTRNGVDKEPLCGCAISKSLFIYLFIYYSFVNRWELRRLKKWRNECTLEALLELQSETLPVIDCYYTFLFFKSPSLWFKSLLEFKKAFM